MRVPYEYLKNSRREIQAERRNSEEKKDFGATYRNRQQEKRRARFIGEHSPKLDGLKKNVNSLVSGVSPGERREKKERKKERKERNHCIPPANERTNKNSTEGLSTVCDAVASTGLLGPAASNQDCSFFLKLKGKGKRTAGALDADIRGNEIYKNSLVIT